MISNDTYFGYWPRSQETGNKRVRVRTRQVGCVSSWVRRNYMKVNPDSHYTFSAGIPKRISLVEEDSGQQWMRVWF